jgi:phosphatidylethanolamine/phosphatidyl-N-methylethanolamine N-methyltransferase
MSRQPASQVAVLRRSASKTAFLRQFLLNPLQVGAVVPSSKYLTESMFVDIELNRVRTYVEYGPGTGRFTEHAFDRLPALKRSILFEINPAFQDFLRESYPKAEIYHGPKDLLVPLVDKVDLVVSGLPFTNIPWNVSEQTLSETLTMLKPGASFRTFLYAHNFLLPKNQKLYRYLKAHFRHVTLRLVMRNVPPAVVIEAWK